MDLNLIKKPVITEKSTTNAQFNKYVFEVRKDSNKKTVKETQKPKNAVQERRTAWRLSEHHHN